MHDQNVIRAFTNMGHMRDGRLFSGFAGLSQVKMRLLEPRGAIRLEVGPGDLLSIDAGNETGFMAVLALDKDGRQRPDALGLTETSKISRADFEAEPLYGWSQARGLPLPDQPTLAVVSSADEPVILKSTAALSVWLINPCSADALSSGGAAGTASILHTPSGGAPRLPEPLGRVREEFTVPRGSALSYEVRKGETFQIIDVEGQQCSDFQAFRMAGLDQQKELLIDSTATRSMVRRAFPGPGLFDKFFDQTLTPLLRVVQDTCGRHDTFGLACTARGYEERGFPGHVNCSDNISDALESYGIERRPGWPAINFFWNTWVDPQFHLMTAESHSRPGDYVAMEALEDLVCVSTACPDDIDPINGWNPTEVHVRIYEPETRLTRAVAYRTKEDAPMLISQESAFHSRVSELTDQFVPARDIWVPRSYPSHGTIGEYWACRNAVTLQDMSGLRKYDIIGPDADRLLQMAMTRDIAKLAQWRGTYSLMCDESGDVIDDGTLFHVGQHLYRWCCGTEESGRWLNTLAERHDLQVRIHDLRNALPNLALQGPNSRALLSRIVFTQPHVPNLEQVKWFGATIARLNDREGAPFMLTRSGYTGELGYEIFCSKDHAVAIWDALMEAGADLGLCPMGADALEIIRIEAGLAAAGAEFAPGVDAFEAGLGFAVDLKKTDFVGKAALERNAAAERRRLIGLKFDSNDVPTHGAPIFSGERQVGEVTSATYSPTFEHAIAMARVSVEHSEIGTKLEVGLLDGRMKRLTGTVSSVPFVDPTRKRARA